MGHCSQDYYLCWTTRLLRVINLLCACCSLAKSSGAHGSGIKEFRTHTSLKAIRGGSVLLHAIPEPGEHTRVEESFWGYGPESQSILLLRIRNGKEDPQWFGLEDKYKQRVQVPNMTSLRIHNLTSQDSGQYWTQFTFPKGRLIKLVFHLDVYDPVPPAQIRATSVSITPSWCNVTLECGATGALDVLNVTWGSKGLPTELEQRGTPGSTDPGTLAVSLPLSQPNVSLTCVVSNPVDQKNATVDLVDICSQDSYGDRTAILMGSIRMSYLAVILILVAGICLWMIYEKVMEMRRSRLYISF
ncbi:SLAM family member 9-like isoform X1 [Sciurus carolinensis]|uniref:SLAM family member 9-like isoform X1 n=1 Tax=Sciurus carolinensis TaxID=30640 RepID=UPI001FB28A04|nr:SLAM family member 9-like isoform X1 [Sciurus carolinensis]